MAGKRKGKADERHLWPEMLRAIREIAPKYIVGENVLGLVNWDGGLVFDEVQADLEAEGYEVATVVIPAAAVNAPHGRDRVWFVAYSSCNGRQKDTQSGASKDEENTKQFKCLHDSRLAQNTMHSGCVQREFSEEGASVRKQRNAGTGDSERICGAEMAGLTADTNCKRHTSCGTGKKAEGEWRGNDGKPQEWLKPTQWPDGLHGFSGLTADAHSNGQHECNSDNEEQSGEGRINAQCNTNTSNVNWDATDSTSTRRREDNGQRKSRFNDKAGAPNDWHNFPTQSPICSGDDGLPTELDGITFSKWRNESIRAYGNAIVPNVAFEIFKVIQIIANT